MANDKDWFDDQEKEEEQDEQVSETNRNFVPVEELNEEELGKLFFSESQVELILARRPDSFSLRVLRGQLISTAKVRQMIVAQAIGGSSEAQKIIEKWLLRINIDAI